MSLPRPRAADEPNRLIVSWNGSGRPSAVRAITSLSSTAASTGSRLVAATTSGTRSVTSARLRVKARTSSPERCTWSRAPSSFHSTPAVPVRASASATSAADWASIGPIGRSTSSLKRPRPSCPSTSAARATTARSPASMCARRTSAAGSPEALATASTITPVSAPCRSSPPRSRVRNRCSGSVAAPSTAASVCRLTAWDPRPSAAATRARAASTSRSSSVGGGGAGGGGSRREAQPTPMRGSVPER